MENIYIKIEKNKETRLHYNFENKSCILFINADEKRDIYNLIEKAKYRINEVIEEEKNIK